MVLSMVNLLKSERSRVLFLFLFSSFLFLIQLGSGTFWERSEPTYAEIAREIVVTGDWLTLHHEFENWYVHPPLYFWLTAMVGSLFGFNEWTTRIVSALFGAGGVLLTYLLGKELFNPRTGFIAALVLMASLEYFILSRIVLMDTLLNFFTLGALYGFLLAYRSKKNRYLLWMYLSTALAVLSKGPVGIVLPLMLIFFFLLFKKDLAYLLRLFHPMGIVLFLLVVFPWYISQISQHGFEFIKVNLLSYTFGRYFGVVEEQAGPFYFYLPVLLLGFFPWVCYLASGWLLLNKERDEAGIFLLACSLVILIFFSLAGTKLPNYIITLFPLMAITLAHLFDSALRAPESPWFRRHLLASNLAAFALTFLLIASGIYFSKDIGSPYNESIPLLVPLAVLAGGGICFSVALYLLRRNILATAAIQGLTVLSILLYVLFFALPESEKYKPFKSFVSQIGSVYRPGEKIGVYGHRIYSIPFYVGTRLGEKTFWYTNEADLRNFLFSKERVYLVVYDQDFERVNKGPLADRIHILSVRQPFVLISNQADL